MSRSDSEKPETTGMTVKGAALYQVHDNGGRPFTVLVDGNGPWRVRAYHTRTEEDDSGFPVPCDREVYRTEPPRPDELAIQWENLEKVWVARCPSLYADEAESLGNSLLLQLKSSGSVHSYVHIGYNIFRFQTKDAITDFESPIDNNDVPYPAALSSSEAFFLAEQMRMPRSLMQKIDAGLLDTIMKGLPADALPWIFFYETLYGTEEVRAQWINDGGSFHPEALPLEGYEELVERP